MPRRLGTQLLTLVLLFSVASFATHAVSHGHSSAAEDLHCQFCHIGHVAIPQPAPQVVVQAPAPIARFESPDIPAHTVGQDRTQSSPRAPPSV
jgi:hypothetical protein